MDLTILYFFIIFVQHSVWCRIYDECQGISEPDVVVASKKSCAKYVFCDGDNSYEGECLAGNYFNKKSGVCDEAKNVDCNINSNDDVKSIYDEDFIHKENEEETTKDVNDIEDNEKVLNTEVEEEIKSGEESEVEENNEIDPTQVYEPKCSLLKGFNNIKHIANPDSCVAFYTCYNGHAIPMLCPAKMYFNENSSKCEPQLPESCKARYSVRLKCYKGVYDFVPHPNRCEYYFYCVNGYLLIMRCPYDFTWHYVRGTCVQKAKSQCYSEKSVISPDND